ncbi:MAG: hypothetical protein PHQ12_14955 [Chthoniobacteraceae bacterium]|nr:hypothetical protein [Chthoniobacteraceae bacterium]
MNSIKTLLLGATGLALAHSASAQITIRIAGSNGDRAATTQAIQNLLVGETYAGIDPTPTKSNFSNFTGGTFGVGGPAVNVKTAFIGATGGIKAVAGSETVRFLPNGATGTANGNPLTDANPHEDAVPDFGVSTNFQSTSPYQGIYNGHTYITLTEVLTGVVALNFVASPGFPADNLTTAQAQALYTGGAIPLAFFTGSPADHNKTVFALGRNSDAGQRYGAQAEIGIGVNAVVKQYQPTVSGTTATSHVLWPRETFSGVDSNFAGNGGYSSGALLAGGLTLTLGPNAYHVGNPSATAGYYIGYVTPSDAATAVTGGATVLKWNGITYSQTAIEEGQYTAWLYTRVIYDPNLAGTVRTFADAIASEVAANTIVNPGGGIKLDNLQVTRNSESGPLGANYF